MTGRRRVVVVTGGGGGIGAAVALALGRRGVHVVTVDPLVSVDGAEQLATPEETTAGRIVSDGGSAQASSASVTDRDALDDLFRSLVEDHGGVDGVVNVAGITRPIGLTRGSEADWRAVLEVHLDGYRNVLAAAMPHLAAAGHGRVVGVTSGSGWRAADAGGYSAAKRAVAALTWQLGPVAPPGVTVNAVSPIAVTRMVTAALSRARPTAGGGNGASTGGLSLGSMPQPEELAPLGAHLADGPIDWLRGHVLFAGGPEVAVVDPPRLLEVVRTSGVGALPAYLDTVVPAALGVAEQHQSTAGGTNPRFTAVASDPARSTGARCVVAIADPGLRAAVTAALTARGATCPVVDPTIVHGAASAADALAAITSADGPIDAVVVGGRRQPEGDACEWTGVLASHEGIVDGLLADAGWSRAAAELATGRDTGRAATLRLVTLTDATTAGGRSRAQAVAQLSRVGRSATGDALRAFAVAVESTTDDDRRVAGELAAHLVAAPEADADALAGAELAVGAGWLGVRSHPRPGTSLVVGGGDLPEFFDDVLRRSLGIGGAS